MIKVNYNIDTGKVQGFYHEDVKYKSIPQPTITITKEQWQNALELQSQNKEIFVENGYIIGKEKEDKQTQEQIYNQELISLEQWFTYYDRQIAEYGRCQRLGIKYENSQNLTISQLDKLAESNKTRINELRSILNVKD